MDNYSLLPNQELSGPKSELQWETVGVCSSYKRVNIIYLRPIYGLHYETRKCIYLRILISEAPTNKKYKNKMHTEATIFWRPFQ